MSIFHYLIIFYWLIFLVYWLISAIGVKRNIKSHSLWQSIRFRLVIILILFFFARTPIFGHSFQHMIGNYFHELRNETLASPNYFLDGIGVIFTAVGITFAIWARIHLGRNWGMPMSVKEKPDLIRSGPYAFVRHPIYAGMLTALIGSAFVDGLFWFIPLIISGGYFFYSIKEEEKLLLKQFPQQYSDYKKWTKKLIPFIY